MQRVINIDIYNLMQATYFGGYAGEDNATKLVFDLPSDYIADDITYIIDFDVADGTQKIANITAAPVELWLPSALMVAGNLVLQLTAMQGQAVIYKTPKITLRIRSAVGQLGNSNYTGLIDDSIAKFNAACLKLEQVGAKVERVTGGALVTVTDQKGTTTAMIYDGTGGGSSGRSITDCTINADGHLIITYSDSTTQDCGNAKGDRGLQGVKGDTGEQGIKGDKGDKGDTGLQGANGADGYSPTATVTQTSTGAAISITDKSGTTTANVTNGTDGSNTLIDTAMSDTSVNAVANKVIKSYVDSKVLNLTMSNVTANEYFDIVDDNGTVISPDIDDNNNNDDGGVTYVKDGLELMLDAINNTKLGHSSAATLQWEDVSGNDYATNLSSDLTTYVVKDTYIIGDPRGQIGVSENSVATLLSKLKDSWSVEIIWQPKADTLGNKKSLFGVGNGIACYPLLASGQMVNVPHNTIYGTGTSGIESIRHYTLTYDGKTMTLYHDAKINVFVDNIVDLSTFSRCCFFGNAAYAEAIAGYFCGVRVYSKSLSQDEITANYNADIVRYGTAIS